MNQMKAITSFSPRQRTGEAAATTEAVAAGVAGAVAAVGACPGEAHFRDKQFLEASAREEEAPAAPRLPLLSSP